MIIVEQPLGGRARVDAFLTGPQQSGVRVGQNATRGCQSGQQTRRAQRPWLIGELLTTRNGAGAGGEVLRAEQIAVNRTGQ